MQIVINDLYTPWAIFLLGAVVGWFLRYGYQRLINHLYQKKIKNDAYLFRGGLNAP
jgi:hypothetical protein